MCKGSTARAQPNTRGGFGFGHGREVLGMRARRYDVHHMHVTFMWFGGLSSVCKALLGPVALRTK